MELVLGQGLKQRLIGATVLLSLLVIIAPALFSGGETYLETREKSTQNSIVETPQVPAFIHQLDIAPENIDVLSHSEIHLGVDEKNTGLDDDGQLKAWSLQVGTFADRNNARILERLLKAKKYSAYQRKISVEKGKIFYKVFIGPEVEPKDLEQVKRVLKQDLNLNGIIVRFIP